MDLPNLEPSGACGTDQAKRIALALIAERAPVGTVCPSEIARALAKQDRGGENADDWRSAMPVVHAAIDALIEEGIVRLSWKGKVLDERKGPYRIGSLNSN